MIRLLAALLAGFARAAAPLTLDEVLASVDADMPLLLAAAADIDAARAARLGASGSYDLDLSAKAAAAPLGDYQYSTASAGVEQLTPLWGTRLQAGYDLGTGEIPSYYGELATYEGGEVSAGVAVPLLKGGRIDDPRTALLVTEQGIAAAEAAYGSARLVVVRDATAAWWRWAVAGRRLALAEELLAIAKARDAAIATRVRTGDLAAFEQLDNQRIILERSGAVVDARRNLEQARLDLGLYLRDAEGRALAPEADRLPLELPPPPADEGLSGEDPVALALARRPELQRMDALIAAAEADLRLAQNGMAPKLDLEGEIAQPVAGSGPEAKVGLSFQLDAQRRTARGKLQAAEAKLAKLEADRRWLADRIANEVERARVALQAARERHALARESAGLARALEEAEQQRFDLGDSDLLRVYQREQIYADAVTAELAALLETWTALATFRAAIGG